MRTFIAGLLAACALNAGTLSDAEIQGAIKRGRHIKSPWMEMFKMGKKQHLDFGGFSLLLRATILKPTDRIAFDVADRQRREESISVEDERLRFPANRVAVRLESGAGGVFASHAGNYREAHVLLIVNGQKLQPVSFSKTEGQVTLGEYGGDQHFVILFFFDLPDSITNVQMTVIGFNGSRKTKQINPALL